MIESDGQNGQEIRTLRLTVAQDGSGDYDMVGATPVALGDKEGPPARICIKKDVYRERLEIKRPGITLEGQTTGDTVITCGLPAGVVMEDGSRRGTFRTYSVLADAHDSTARDSTVESSIDPGETAGQALALYVDGDRILFEGCRLLGGQDAFFTGPLPPKEIQKDRFVGPKQFSPRINGRHCYRGCFIRGDIGLVLGSAAAYFDRCKLYSAGRDTERKEYVATASTPRGQKYGYVSRNYRLTGNNPREGVYLGRPWRDYVRTVLIGYYLGPRICREGWHDWDKRGARSTLFYGEYGSYGPGATDREASEQGKRDRDTSGPGWVPMLTHKQTRDYTMKQVLGGMGGWSPGHIL